MNLSDTFYVALCMTVLILGAVYWFWTQNQFILRKLNLLENIVYEMKTALPTSWNGNGASHDGFGAFGVPSAEPPSASPVEASATYAPAPGSVISDEDADILHEDLTRDLGSQTNSGSPVLQVLSAENAASTEQVVADDLQPGGVGSGFARSDAPDIEGGRKAINANPLDGMSLKELRRLGEARGISGASGMRKQTLIDALRSAPVGELSFDQPGGTLDLTEGIVDLA